ncbi:MAG: hydrogenase maturation protease [Deltaproteobacteria bacterium]|nr:hydrogenase maturation protease [Deltaproteobacteria bacterium]
MGLINLKTAVIGIGNSILSDDGVGIKAVKTLESMYKAKHKEKHNEHNGRGIGGSKVTEVTEFIEVSTGGINLMEYMAGFRRAVIIDAIVTGRHKAGTVFKFIYPDIPFTKNTVSTHDVDLPTAIETANYLGISLPSEIIIFAVEAKDTVNFGENLTEEVESALVNVINEIKSMLRI